MEWIDLCLVGIPILAVLYVTYQVWCSIKRADRREEVEAYMKMMTSRVLTYSRTYPSDDEYHHISPDGPPLLSIDGDTAGVEVYRNGFEGEWSNCSVADKSATGAHPGCHVVDGRERRFIPFPRILGLYPIGVTKKQLSGKEEFLQGLQIETIDSLMILVLFSDEPEKEMASMKQALGEMWELVYKSHDVLGGEIVHTMKDRVLSDLYFGDVYFPKYMRKKRSRGEPDHVMKE